MIPSGSTEAPPPPSTSSSTPRAGERRGVRPAARQRLAVEEQPGDARERGRGPERDDRADRDAGAVDRREERRAGRRRSRPRSRRAPAAARAPPRPAPRARRAGAAPADRDPGRTDRERRGLGAERLRRPGGAEADGGEENEDPWHLGALWQQVSTHVRCVGIRGAGRAVLAAFAGRLRARRDRRSGRRPARRRLRRPTAPRAPAPARARP